MRRLGCTLALAGLLAVTGCSVEGTIDVTATEVRADVVIREAADNPDYGACGRSADGGVTFPSLKRDSVDAPAGQVGCRLHGTIAHTSPYPQAVVGEGAIFVSLPGTGVGVPGAMVQERLERVDLRISFPGEVIAASSGTVSGRVVTFAHPSQLDGVGVRLVGSDGGPRLWPPLGWVAVGAAALLGAAGTWWALRRRPILPEPPAAVGAAEPDTTGDAPPTAGRQDAGPGPPDASVWSRA